MERINVRALFLGPKAENQKFFKEMLNYMIDDHIDWRRDFHPQDQPVVTPEEQASEDFRFTLQKTRESLIDLAGNLQLHSIPWFSPRYLGHMNADTLMAANLAYMLTLLYNPNNCAYEGSPATTALEIEVGRQLAGLFGYDPQKAWGHITSGGTIANYEGLWVARNLKSVPLAIKAVKAEWMNGLDDWQLLNLPTSWMLDLLDRAKNEGIFDQVRQLSVRGTGLKGIGLGKLLVPQSKHYSWIKAADILGIGQENLVFIRVKENYRMDIDHLRETLDRLVEERTPILAVVAVVGTTEEGAVDEVHEVVRLRKAYEAKGVSFYLHIDAAYGGYARTIFLDEENRFMDLPDLRQALHHHSILSPEVDWPDASVYEAFKAMPEADSITIDPHKMGYVPYAAGAIVLKDRRVLDLISYFAAYVFEKSEENPLLLGSYIMEGSKAGATVAAVWMAHRILALNMAGYGRIIGCSIEGADRFYRFLMTAKPFEVDGRRFKVRPLNRPDFNIVDFAFNEEGNRSLTAMNELNRKIYERCSYRSGPVYLNDFITSKTTLSFEEYGETPKSFAAALGVPAQEWEKTKSVYVLRSCVVTPYLGSQNASGQYWHCFMKTLEEKLKEALRS